MIRQQRYERAGGETAVDDKPAAIEKNRGGGERQHGSGQRTRQERCLLHSEQSADEAGIVFAELRGFARLRVACRDEPEPRQRFDQEASYIRATFPYSSNLQ